jgi:cytochrome c oxidase assembly protein subunit 15
MTTTSPKLVNAALYNAALHRFAQIVTAAVLLMIVAGGMVTSMDAGDSVPDWPLSHGSVLPRMVGNVFYEHGHRMIGWLLGLLSITLAVWLQVAEKRRWVRVLGWLALSGVCLQGALGGLRVLVVSNPRVQDFFFADPTGAKVETLRVIIAIIHTASGQALLCVMAILALVTSKRWLVSAPMLSGNARRFRILCVSTLVIVFIQLLLGALRRHTNGTIHPHLLGAALVTFHVALLARRVLLSFAHVPALLRPTISLITVVALQLTLGVMSWILLESASAESLPRPTVLGSEVFGSAVLTAHVVLGAATMLLTVILTLRAYSQLDAGAAAGSPGRSEQGHTKGRVATA